MKLKNETKKENVTFISVPEDRADQRIDNFLISQFKKVPKTHIYKILRKGEIRVNKKRARPEYRLQADDLIRIPPIYAACSAKLMPNVKAMQLLEKRIIYEDDGLLIVNKPSGMASHGGSGINFGIIETLRAGRAKESLELVHRLDRSTSGCLIIAKKRSVLKMLHEMLRDGKIIKKYLLLAKGNWQGGQRIVDVPLLKNQINSGERIVKVNEERGKTAFTKFIPQKRFKEATLLEAVLYTGRTHQIRVHAAHIGYPLAGDEKYGCDEFNHLMRENGLKRLFLHAHSLDFKLPNGGKTVSVKSDLDDELGVVLTNLTP